MSPKIKAVPIESSSSSESEEDEKSQKRIKLIRELSELEKPVGRFTGGIKMSTESDILGHSTSASMSAIEKKGLKEVEELERELDLKNTFSKETNRRDEDAEMNKYIDEQIRLRREAAKKERQKQEDKDTTKSDSPELSEMFSLPANDGYKVDDILLHSLSKHLASTSDEKSEAMLSSQMLNGIPEVDLGINERIRTIEATEEAKLKLAAGGMSRNSSRSGGGAPVNFSSNFQHHRSHRDGDFRSNKSNRHTNNGSEGKMVTEAVVVVGEEPDEVEYRVPVQKSERPPPKGKASDDYYLSKFKKNSRR